MLLEDFELIWLVHVIMTQAKRSKNVLYIFAHNAFINPSNQMLFHLDWLGLRVVWSFVHMLLFLSLISFPFSFFLLSSKWSCHVYWILSGKKEILFLSFFLKAFIFISMLMLFVFVSFFPQDIIFFYYINKNAEIKAALKVVYSPGILLSAQNL